MDTSRASGIRSLVATSLRAVQNGGSSEIDVRWPSIEKEREGLDLTDHGERAYNM